MQARRARTGRFTPTVAFIVAVLLVVNEFVLAFFFSVDARITSRAVWIIRAVDAGLLVGLVATVLLRPRPGDIVKHAFRRWPNAAASVAGLSAATLLVAVVELGFQSYNIISARNGPETIKSFSTTLWDWPTVCHSSKKVGDRLLYDVTYTVNKIGARATPASPEESTGQDLVFFGGSFTFGEGVEDHETLPNRVAIRSPGRRVTNLGFPGYGPGQMLRRIELREGLESFSGNSPHAIYVYIPAHVRRVIGTMRLTTTWARDFPYYAISTVGELEYRGTMTTGRPILSRVYSRLAREPIMKCFEVDLPPRFDGDDYELTARVIEASRSGWLETFPNGDFTVVIYPGKNEGRDPPARILPYLRKYGLRVLDYSGRLDGITGMWIPLDGHPTPAALDRVAEWLVADLAEISPE